MGPAMVVVVWLAAATVLVFLYSLTAALLRRQGRSWFTIRTGAGSGDPRFHQN